MRLSWFTGRGAVIAAAGTLFILTIKFSVDKSYIKVSELNNQLSQIRERYNVMRGFLPDETTQKVPEACKPHSKVAFAKTHKTGSSTLQNIFFRYGNLNGLTFAIPERSWMFSFKEPFSASMVMNLPWAKLGYDLFAFHSVWNYPEMQKVLPSAVYITLLRDPVECYESNYVYMGLENAFGMNINEYAKKKASLDPPRRTTAIIGKNQMLWDLGMGWKEMDNQTLVQNKVEELDSQFQFVLLAEQFDESLVILARMLCWDLESVRYLKQNARKSESKKNITEEARTTLRKWLRSDYILYDHFKAKFQEEANRYGREKLAADVLRLQELNRELTEECVLEVADNSKLKGEFRMALNIVEGYVINENKPWCAQFARSEPNFSVQVRKKQQLRAGFVGKKQLSPKIDREAMLKAVKKMQKNR